MDKRRRGRGGARQNRSANGAAQQEQLQPAPVAEISDMEVLVEFKKLLNLDLPEAQAAKQQYDESHNRAAFTKRAKELVMQHRHATAASPGAKPAAAPPVQVPREAAAPAESVQPPAVDGAAAKPAKERQQRPSKKEEGKGKKTNKKWEPKGAKKAPVQNETQKESGEKADGATTPEQSAPAHVASPAGQDEAAARLQELLSSDSAFSTSFAFSRWRASVADDSTPQDQLETEEAHPSEVGAAATQLNSLSINGHSDQKSALVHEHEQHAQSTGNAPPHEDSAAELVEQSAHQVDEPFMQNRPHPMFYPPPMHEMGHFPPYFGHMMPRSPTRGNSDAPVSSSPDAHRPPAEPWNMMSGYGHPVRPPGMSPPPMMAFGMPWDPRMESREHLSGEHSAPPEHGRQAQDMPHFMPPHAFMMGPFAGFAMPAPPAFMGMHYNGPYPGMPYPFPGRPPMEGHMDGEAAATLHNESSTTAAGHLDERLEPERTGEVRDEHPTHPSSVELSIPEQHATKELDGQDDDDDVLKPSDVEVVPPTGSTLESDTRSLLRLLRMTPPVPNESLPSVASSQQHAQQQPAPAVAGTPLATTEQKADEEKEAKDKPAAAARPAKHVAPRTISKGHPGALSIFINNRHAQEGMTVRPHTNMTVKWHIGSDIAGDSEKQLVIGLHRIGVSTNSNNMVTKAVEEHNHVISEQMAYGEVPFRTPRSPGLFVYRLFDAENDTETYATSSFFVVTIAQQDVISGLKYVQQLFGKSDNVSTGLIQLQQALKLVRNPVPNGITKNLIAACLTIAVDHAEKTAVKLHDLAVALDAVAPDAENHADVAKEYYDAERKITRIHSQVFDVIAAANSNAEVWGLVHSDVKQRINDLLNRYCPLLQTVYISSEELHKRRMEKLGFIPAMFRRAAAPPAVTMTLSRAIDEMLPSLFPSPEFFSRREGVRLRILQALESAGIMPANSQLTVFGSSANNFGSDCSDLDMCLRHPQGVAAPDDKAKFIEQVAEYMERLGMSEVNCRSTARIPIVLFREPTTGLECDISMYNALAVRNTQLLHTYSRIDPRVRAMAYVIKHWTKARHINSPPHGTLSSYGYVLCLIHFLQTRQPPVLPNLQKLPPDWRGEDLHPSQAVNVPKVTVTHPVDGTQCDAYFYVPAEHNFSTLNVYASRNTQSVGELLMEFFGYFAWQFDYKEHVVSVRTGRKLPKYVKGEYDCWTQSSRLSIEDPFETWYDVAHPVKDKGHRFIRKEFVRAYTLCVKACGWNDGLNDPIQLQSLLAKVCEVGELPAFMRSADEHHEDEESPNTAQEKGDNAAQPRSDEPQA